MASSPDMSKIAMSESAASLANEPSPKSRPSRRRRTRPSIGKRLARNTELFERWARLGINTLLTAVALTALGRLIPHLHSQAAQLEMVNQAVARAESSTSKLQADFGRYFDPWQAENIMQEQSGYRPPTERQVVWTQDEDATAEPAAEVSAGEANDEAAANEVQAEDPSPSNPMAKPLTDEPAAVEAVSEVGSSTN